MTKKFRRHGEHLTCHRFIRKANRTKKNYWGIAVIPTIGRLFSIVLRNLIEEDIKTRQPEEQAVFRAG